MVLVGELVSRQQATNAANTGDLRPQTEMTTPIPNDPNNVFSYPDPNRPGRMQSPASGVVIPQTVGGVPVDGSERLSGQRGIYGFTIAPWAAGQRPALTVTSPESPASDSAANMRLKDASVYNFLTTMEH